MIYDTASYSKKHSRTSSTFAVIMIQVFWENVTMNLTTEFSVNLFWK